MELVFILIKKHTCLHYSYTLNSNTLTNYLTNFCLFHCSVSADDSFQLLKRMVEKKKMVERRLTDDDLRR